MSFYAAHGSGFAVLHNILSHKECDEILNDLTSGKNGRAGSRGLFENDDVKRIARDPRLMAMAEAFLEAKPIPFKATLFNKTSDSNWLVVWHQDRVLPPKEKVDWPDWEPWTTKSGVHFAQAPAWAMGRIVALRLHLDDSIEANGPLRVLPGSHHRGVLDQKDVIDLAAQSTAATLTVSKGGIIAMRPLLIHASGRMASDEPRRVLHIEYTDSLVFGDGAEIAFC